MAEGTSNKHRRRFVLVPAVVVLLAGGGFGLWFYAHNTNTPVPKNISQAVDFPVYYPNPKKLPEGYTLDISSFKVPVKNGVTYSITYDHDKSIVFSLQPKVSSDEYQTFEGNYLPLRISYQTPVGQAEIGAYNLETLVSLPIVNNNTWVIVTAPGNINQEQLEQVLSSLK